jgi:uncharacterized protein (TIGR00369 family)
MEQEDLLARIRESTRGRFWERVGIETVSAEPGRVVCRVRLADYHFNSNDVVHGGVISSLIDSAAGSAVRTLRSDAEIRERPHATSDLHVSYLAAARGSELVAEARVARLGRTAAFIQVDVRDDGGRVVALGMATFVIAGRREAAG